jgi:hypothetical protein
LARPWQWSAWREVGVEMMLEVGIHATRGLIMGNVQWRKGDW